MNTKRWVGEPGQLAGVLDALELVDKFTPECFGRDELHLKPYSRKAVLAKTPKKRGSEWFLMLQRSSPAVYDCTIASVDGTILQLGFKDEPPGGWKVVFELADEMARRVGPQVLSVSHLFERRDPAEGVDAETIDWIIESGETYEPLLRQYGLIGLAPRTYLGPELVELIGRQCIDALELPRAWLKGGGVRLDLVPEPWNARVEELTRPWRAAMSILRDSEVFSTGKVASTGQVLARRGRRWV